MAIKKTTKKVVKKTTPLNVYASIYEEMKAYEVDLITNDTKPDKYELLKFKSVAMNMISGGGIIVGTATEVSGPSQTGKSYLAYEMMAEILNLGGHAYLNDNECAYSKVYGKRSGILEGKQYLLDQEKDIDTFFRKSRAFIKAVRKYDKTGFIGIITDSYGGLSTNIDMDNEEAMKDPRGYMYMHKANTFGTNMRTFTKYLKKYNANLIVLTQARLDKENSTKYYKQYISAAEDTLNFFYTQRFRILAGGKEYVAIKRGDKKVNKAVGQTIKVECIKNRIAPPFQKAEIVVNFNKGIYPLSGVEQILLDEELISSGKFTVDDKKVKGYMVKSTKQKYTDFKQLVEEHPHLIEPKNHFNTDYSELDVDQEALISEDELAA
jgi:RecA/RadA recombinase